MESTQDQGSTQDEPTTWEMLLTGMVWMLLYRHSKRDELFTVDVPTYGTADPRPELVVMTPDAEILITIHQKRREE